MTARELLQAVLDPYGDDPRRWTQGAAARNELGRSVAIDDDRACCWCLSGAFMRCAAGDQYSFRQAWRLLRPGAVWWQDRPRRTFADVRALLLAALEKAQ